MDESKRKSFTNSAYGIIKAGDLYYARKDMLGGALYLVGKEKSTGELVKNAMPCAMCKRQIINSGIERLLISNPPRILGEVVSPKIYALPLS